MDALQWWHWLILAIVVVAVGITTLLAVQARRRSGGVLIADVDEGSAHDDRAGDR